MEPPRECTVERIEATEVGDLVSEALRYAAGRTPRPGRAYHVVIVTADGGPEILELLHFEATNRAGIAWSGRDWWLDAASVDEALHRWLQGEGKLSAARLHDSAD